MQQRNFLFFVLLITLSCNTARKNNSVAPNAYNYSVKKKTIASNGAVVSAHPLASQVGLSIMKKGVNAVDAAIATQLALAVVYPQAGNLGGGGFMVAVLKDDRAQPKEIAIDYREMAPGRASRDMYVDPGGTARTDKSQDGHLASGRPGTVAGQFESARYGKLQFAQLIQPAIELAEKCFVIREREARNLNALQDELKKFNTVMPAFVK